MLEIKLERLICIRSFNQDINQLPVSKSMITKKTFAMTALMTVMMMTMIPATTQMAFGQLGTSAIPAGTSIHLILLNDDSGSILPADFALELDGKQAGLQALLDDRPDLFGKLHVDVISFSTTASFQCGATIDDQTDLDTLKACIDAIPQSAGLTCIECAFDEAIVRMALDPFGASPSIEVIDLVTDGTPNVGDATQGRADAIAAGADVIVALGIGSAIDTVGLSNLVYPNAPGPINPDPLPDATLQGFVLTVDDFAGFEQAFKDKLAGEVPPPVVGGEFLPVDSTALFIAGLQSSAIWMLPALAGATGVGAYFIKSRMSKD
jgi:hypothetical protein